jgi:hypothetical protein
MRTISEQYLVITSTVHVVQKKEESVINFVCGSEGSYRSLMTGRITDSQMIKDSNILVDRSAKVFKGRQEPFEYHTFLTKDSRTC